MRRASCGFAFVGRRKSMGGLALGRSGRLGAGRDLRWEVMSFARATPSVVNSLQ